MMLDALFISQLILQEQERKLPQSHVTFRRTPAPSTPQKIFSWIGYTLPALSSILPQFSGDQETEDDDDEYVCKDELTSRRNQRRVDRATSVLESPATFSKVAAAARMMEGSPWKSAETFDFGGYDDAMSAVDSFETKRRESFTVEVRVHYTATRSL